MYEYQTRWSGVLLSNAIFVFAKALQRVILAAQDEEERPSSVRTARATRLTSDITSMLLLFTSATASNAASAAGVCRPYAVLAVFETVLVFHEHGYTNKYSEGVLSRLSTAFTSDPSFLPPMALERVEDDLRPRALAVLQRNRDGFFSMGE